ncbi:unnamed protein product [Porites lobata]|uniref:Uncharacterized protein n=1 Tax=Porites lobata TaxID=104759 RepID=A0ABN8P6L1_9CNID|nr:unnamed protein product [Porites lobata]
MDTLYLLCAQGKLRCLKITNNLVSDSITKFLVERLIGSFCCKCNQESKSLTKFKLSSLQVSEAFCAHLRTAIKDVCFCSLKNLETSSTHKSETTDSEDSLKSECMDLGISLGGKRKTKFQDPVKIRDSPWQYSGDLNFINRNDNCTKTAFDQNYPGSFEAASNMANFTEIPSLDSSEIIQFNGCNFKEFVGLQELRLTCPVGDRGASLISDGLQSNSSLLSLSLVNCNISTAGLGDIFNAITGHRSLKHLSVKGNRYDPSRNNKLAEMLTVNKTLTDLNLSSCGLGGKAKKFISDIFHALCINSTLTSLKLGENILGDSHTAALSQVFTHPNKTSVIKKLDLSNNPISLEGLSVLASSLECIKPRKLDELKLTAANILGSKPHRVLSNLQCMVHTLIVERLDKATLFADFLSQM